MIDSSDQKKKKKKKKRESVGLFIRTSTWSIDPVLKLSYLRKI